MKVTFIALLLLCAIGSNLAVMSEAPDMLEREIEQYHDTIRQEIGHLNGFDEVVHPDHVESFKKVVSSTKWVCTGGQDPSTLSNQEYVRAFAAGPCNPTVVLPGIAGSKLVATIDCKKFKKSSPSTFKACGW